MAAYRGSGGAVFDIDVPGEGTPARERFDAQVASGALTLVDAAPTEEPKPATIAEIKADVGDDKEKAQAALDAENAADEPRSTLVKHLEAILEDD